MKNSLQQNSRIGVASTMMSIMCRQRSLQSVFLCTILLNLVLLTQVYAFVRPLPAYSRHVTTYSTPNDNDDNEIYDDFGGGVIGDPQHASAPSSQLQELIRDVREEQVRKDAQLAKNWKTGNWKVRGFSLDKHSHDENEESTQQQPIHVSKVHESSTHNQVICGRTDGSVCFVRLGTEYLTQFVGKLTARETGNATIEVTKELVAQDTFLSEQQQEEATPFSVDLQFQAHDSAIVAMEEKDNLLFTSCKNSGEIRVWQLPSEDDDKVTPLKSLTEAHSDTVVSLSTISQTPHDDDEDNLLFSASIDGTLALWDIATGDLVYKCQMMHDQEPCAVLCADVDQSLVYLGMASGHVVGYNVEEMVESAAEGASCPIPSGRFLAHEGGVSAIACAGEGSLGRSSSNESSSSILLTGGTDGIVKQWEILSRKQDMSPSLKLEQWPRMATQRMQKRAHLFQGHDASITALASIDNTKFLSAGADGTVRAWSPSTGEELFRMDGFTEQLSSLCLQEDLYLITDGMEEFVCVHDFDVLSTEVEDGYELEW